MPGPALKLLKGPGLDLTDPLAHDAVPVTDLFKRVIGGNADSVAQPQNGAVAFGEVRKQGLHRACERSRNAGPFGVRGQLVNQSRGDGVTGAVGLIEG